MQKKTPKKQEEKSKVGLMSLHIKLIQLFWRKKSLCAEILFNIHYSVKIGLVAKI